MAPKKTPTHTILHTSNTISDVIRTLQDIKHDTLLYIPEEMYVLYNPINRKILAREVLAHKKHQIQFFSPDHHLVDLLRDEHLEANTTENLDLPEPNHTPEVDPFADFFRYDSVNEFDTPPSSEASYQDPITPARSVTQPSSRTPDQASFSPWKYIIAGVLSALVVAGIVMVIFVPQATITLTQQGEIFSQDFEVTFDTTISAVDTEDNRVPLYRKEVTREVTQEFESTGTSESGRRAQATITVRNESSSSQSLVANTRFLSDNQRQFRTTSAITVPAQGSTEVEIIADAVGEEYNIEPGRLTIPGLASSGSRARQIYGDLRTPITNGSADNQSIVTQEDVDTVQEALREQIAQALNEGLEDGEDGRSPLRRSRTLPEVQFVDLPAVGTVAETFTVTARSTLNGYVYQDDQLQNFVRERVSGQLLNGRELADTLELSFDDLEESSENGRIRTRVFAEYGVVSPIDQADAIRSLRGRRLVALENYVQQNESIQEARLEVRPSFLPIFPFLGRNITIQIES